MTRDKWLERKSALEKEPPDWMLIFLRMFAQTDMEQYGGDRSCMLAIASDRIEVLERLRPLLDECVSMVERNEYAPNLASHVAEIAKVWKGECAK